MVIRKAQYVQTSYLKFAFLLFNKLAVGYDNNSELFNYD